MGWPFSPSPLCKISNGVKLKEVAETGSSSSLTATFAKSLVTNLVTSYLGQLVDVSKEYYLQSVLIKSCGTP